MPYMTRLLSDLKDAGLMVETVPGWETRGSASFAPAGVTCHWTAGPRRTTKRPSLNVVTYGRPGLPGPLCNVYLDRNGVAVIVAAGRANHAGAGGWKHLRGNSSVYGIEAESAGDDDWTEAQQKAYPRLVAAMLRGLGRDASYAHGHNEWAPTRKIDIRDWPMATMRTQVAKLLAGPQAAPTAGKAPTTPAQDLLERIANVAVYVFFTLDEAGARRAVRNTVAGWWMELPADKVDSFRIQREREGFKRGEGWAWHDELGNSTRHVSAADLGLFGERREWGK